ncbi:MAG: hypothetical protein LWX56_11155 [Ignavibacteria bacterium]|nr:hypothetical protein [Ignavibacteria bacterium]
MKVRLDFVPKTRIGPFILGADLRDYAALSLIELPEEIDQDDGCTVYTLKDQDIRIYCKGPIIYSITCYDECFIDNQNIIGMLYSEFFQLLKIEPTVISREDLDDGIRDIYEYDDIGILIYIKDDIIALISWY